MGMPGEYPVIEMSVPGPLYNDKCHSICKKIGPELTAFRLQLDECLDKVADGGRVIVNMEMCHFIGEDACGVLVEASKKGQRRNIKFVIEDARGQVQEKFATTKLDEVFRVT